MGTTRWSISVSSCATSLRRSSGSTAAGRSTDGTGYAAAAAGRGCRLRIRREPTLTAARHPGECDLHPQNPRLRRLDTGRRRTAGKVADCAQLELALQGATSPRITLADYPLPLMNEDLEREQGIPDNAYKLARLFASHDALLICTPEYNGSLPPLLKNTIDWVSRISRTAAGR